MSSHHCQFAPPRPLAQLCPAPPAAAKAEGRKQMRWCSQAYGKMCSALANMPAAKGSRFVMITGMQWLVALGESPQSLRDQGDLAVNQYGLFEQQAWHVTLIQAFEAPQLLPSAHPPRLTDEHRKNASGEV